MTKLSSLFSKWREAFALCFPNRHSPEGLSIPVSDPGLSAAIWKHSHLCWVAKGWPAKVFSQKRLLDGSWGQSTLLPPPSTGTGHGHCQQCVGLSQKHAPLAEVAAQGFGDSSWQEAEWQVFPLEWLKEQNAYKAPYFTAAGSSAVSQFLSGIWDLKARGVLRLLMCGEISMLRFNLEA